MIIKFPTHIKYTKENPLLDFYKKCIFAFNNSETLDGFSVTAFTVNPKDNARLNKLLEKYIDKNYPGLTKQKLKFEVEMIMLDFGPRVSSKVKIKTVEIDGDKLYD